MDYKKIIKSRKFRIKIMQFLSFIPDEIMVRLQYRIKTGRKLNLKNPQRFTEKLQYYKLYYRDPLMAQCADKYEVRKYVESCGLGCILNELYGIFDDPDEIDFDALPDSFVMKDTLGGGGNSVIIVKNKSDIDEGQIRKQLREWVNQPVNCKHPGRGWVYEGRPHRIIIEKYIEEDLDKGGLIDYKFFCEKNKAKYLYVITDRKVGGKASFGISDAEFNRLNVVRIDENALEREINKPQNYARLKVVAEKLSKPFPEVRIDLYNVNQKIVFGEITFFDGSGYMSFCPDSFDYEIGKQFTLPGRNNL